MEKVLVRNKLFKVSAYTIKKHNKKIKVFRISEPAKVVVLPFLNNNTLLLEHQYRAAINRYIYEIPAGAIERGEKPVKAAARELEEETGYTANSLKFLFWMYSSPGLSTEILYAYSAHDLIKSSRNPDEDEIIDVKKIRLDKALQLIKNNTIRDAKTIACILYYLRFIKRK